jgi:hypothetical protein
MTVEEILNRCSAVKAEYEKAIEEKENTWAKYVNARDWCQQVAVRFYAVTDELDRAKEKIAQS